ncbi:MAG TPA: hypothetical protein VIZ69_02880 [Thermoanaerobaculia bacterium]
MYERRHHPPLPFATFVRRVALHFLAATGVVAASLAIGMAGYEHFENMAWRDAFLNAAMLLGGMGPVDAPKTDGGKVFAGAYALYAGLVFIVTFGILLTPLLHRLVHKFHWETK